MKPNQKVFIQDLKKNNVFHFNHTDYVVQKKYRSDESPLITTCGQLFHYEELEVVFVSKTLVETV